MIPWIISQPSCHRVILLRHYVATCVHSPGVPMAGDTRGPACDIPLLRVGLRTDGREGSVTLGQLAPFGTWGCLGYTRAWDLLGSFVAGHRAPGLRVALAVWPFLLWWHWEWGLAPRMGVLAEPRPRSARSGRPEPCISQGSTSRVSQRGRGGWDAAWDLEGGSVPATGPIANVPHETRPHATQPGAFLRRNRGNSYL